jgi:hypothetical protein
MERRIVSEYKFDAGRTGAETLVLAEASKAQLLGPEPLTQERRLVIIDSWARALGDALRCFDEATGKLASSQIYGAKEVLKTGADKEMFWGALLACVIAHSEEENGDIFVGMASFEYLKNFADWGYDESQKAGTTPAELGSAFQWVPTPWIPQARVFVESWANGAPEDKRSKVFAEIAGEVERIQKSVSQWGGKLREATMAVAKEWAQRGSTAAAVEPPV